MTADPLGPRRWLARAAAAIIILVGLAAVAFAGCATTHAVATVAKSCEPTSDQEAQIIAALGDPSQDAALAAVDALGFGLCVLKRGVDEIIATLTAPPGTTTISATAADYSPVLANARAWRATHP